MPASADRTDGFCHTSLPGGVELAIDPLPQRQTVALCVRLLSGAVDDPPELGGISGIVERTMSKGTSRYDGQALADAFDALGASWSSATGRQSTLVRVLCLPEFTSAALDLVAEMLCRPKFDDKACEVAVQLGIEELKHMQDDPSDLLRLDIQRLTLGPEFGRDPAGEIASLERITSEAVRSHWRRAYQAGRLQVAVAGPVDSGALAGQVDELFRTLGSGKRTGREPADFSFTPAVNHRQKDLKQQYIGITLPGAAKGAADFAAEQMLIAVLAGGMSGRLFTEVREKQGLVYWVGAWHEQPRGKGIIHLGASTTPERCEQTYRTLLRELERLAEDLSDEEIERARNGILAHAQTEDDLTRARAGGLSDDLFHFSKPIGLPAKLEPIRRITADQVRDYAVRLPHDRICVATVGPQAPAI